jgi:hypothetical protein
MSNELESNGPDLTSESFGVTVDGASAGSSYDETETETPSSVDKPAVEIMLQVTQIVRFLLERGLRLNLRT